MFCVFQTVLDWWTFLWWSGCKRALSKHYSSTCWPIIPTTPSSSPGFFRNWLTSGHWSLSMLSSCRTSKQRRTRHCTLCCRRSTETCTDESARLGPTLEKCQDVKPAAAAVMTFTDTYQCPVGNSLCYCYCGRGLL